MNEIRAVLYIMALWVYVLTALSAGIGFSSGNWIMVIVSLPGAWMASRGLTEYAAK